jgi:hypothetical protein
MAARGRRGWGSLRRRDLSPPAIGGPRAPSQPVGVGNGPGTSRDERWVYSRYPWAAGCSPGIGESDCGYLAGRKETWIWMATPGAEKPRMSLAV